MKAYARGMIDAALFLEGKAFGFYQIEDAEAPMQKDAFLTSR